MSSRDKLIRAHSLHPTVKVIQKDRRQSQQQTEETSRGGILVSCIPQLQPKEETIQVPDLEYLSVIIPYSDIGPLRVVTVYKKPSVKMEIFMHGMNLLLKAIHQHRNQMVTIVVGDFNENLLLKKKTPLLDLMSSYRYTQIVTKPTTDQGSLLDHVYINEVNICHTVDILDTYYSDHDAVLLTLCLR